VEPDGIGRKADKRREDAMSGWNGMNVVSLLRKRRNPFQFHAMTVKGIAALQLAAAGIATEEAAIPSLVWVGLKANGWKFVCRTT
jgi:hypothetical protein